MPFHTDPNKAFQTAQRRGISPLVERLGLRASLQGIPPGSAFGPGGTLEGLIGGGILDDLLASGDLTLDDLLGFGLGDGGGNAGLAFGSTQAGTQLAQQQLLEQLGIEQAFEAQQAQLGREFETAETEKARLFEREQELERLKAERQKTFSDLLGTDPVRAVLFGLGIGGELVPGAGAVGNLPPIKEAVAARAPTEQALSKLVSRTVGIGQQGVTGLGSASQAAAAFGGQAGGRGGNIRDQQKLLLSGFGVGATKGQGRPGQSREETLRQIAAVTPRGVL